mmetsp:Transcript_54053/g.78954  ORF Transcript_54053/g.78954 Transcript_54053/m.78954 type:complete len:308 (+) Transcript_54053:51-974(+)
MTQDDREYVVKRYLDGSEEVLLDCQRSCIVQHGVDATNLQSSFDQGAFDLIIFNFPHHPGKGKIQKNRQLLLDFFRSAEALLPADDPLEERSRHSPLPEIRVALARGQGGTPADYPVRVWGNSWQVVEQASQAGLVLKSVEPFNYELWQELGYRCVGRRSQGRGAFHAGEGALVHAFVRAGRGAPGLHPVPRAHDLSFWYSEISHDQFLLQQSNQDLRSVQIPDFDEEAFLMLIHTVTQGFVQSVTLLETYISPKLHPEKGTHRVSRAYRLCYCAYSDKALCKQEVALMQNQLREEIEEAGIGSFMP